MRRAGEGRSGGGGGVGERGGGGGGGGEEEDGLFDRWGEAPSGGEARFLETAVAGAEVSACLLDSSHSADVSHDPSGARGSHGTPEMPNKHSRGRRR